MKKLIVSAIFVATLFAQDKLTVQVLSTEEKTSITEAFMQKLKSLDIPFQTRYSEGRYRVLAGEFKDYDEAQKGLEEIKQKVTPKAFIVPMPAKLSIPKPEQQMQQAIVMAKARTLNKMKKEKVSEEEMETVEPIKISKGEAPVPEKEMIAKSEPKTVVGMHEDVKTEEIFCKPTKKALRESEIAEALAYYRNSTFYQFQK